MSQEELSKQIVDYFIKYDDKENYLSPYDRRVQVEFCTETSLLGKKTEICYVKLIKMYEGLGSWAGYNNLKWLAKLLCTDKIDLKGENYRAGCDTCDYGSAHSITIECRNIKLY